MLTVYVANLSLSCSKPGNGQSWLPSNDITPVPIDCRCLHHAKQTIKQGGLVDWLRSCGPLADGWLGRMTTNTTCMIQ